MVEPEEAARCGVGLGRFGNLILVVWTCVAGSEDEPQFQVRPEVRPDRKSLNATRFSLVLHATAHLTRVTIPPLQVPSRAHGAREPRSEVSGRGQVAVSRLHSKARKYHVRPFHRPGEPGDAPGDPRSDFRHSIRCLRSLGDSATADAKDRLRRLRPMPGAPAASTPPREGEGSAASGRRFEGECSGRRQLRLSVRPPGPAFSAAAFSGEGEVSPPSVSLPKALGRGGRNSEDEGEARASPGPALAATSPGPALAATFSAAAFSAAALATARSATARSATGTVYSRIAGSSAVR
jgi:hypothetical protein